MKKRMYRILAILIAIAIQLTPLQGLAMAMNSSKPEETKKLLVMYKKGVQDTEQKIKGKKIKEYKKLKKKDTYIVEVSESDLNDLYNDSNIQFIEEDAIVSKTEDRITWNIEKVNAPKVHQNNYYGEGIKVALFDTGIDLNNSDIQVTGGVSFVEGVSSYGDDNGHGTAMAGILSSSLNGQGLVGVAPKVELYSVKVLDRDGVGRYSSIIQGIEWAIDNNIDIIAMSFGGDQYSGILKDTIINANNNGILIVAAAGNNGSEVVQYPANYDDVVCTGAVDSSNNLAVFSNTGRQMDIVAPGVDIESVYPGNMSVTVSGTSASVQHVAGVAALIWGAKRDLTVEQLKALLYTNATPLGDEQLFGWGLIDAYKTFENISDNPILPPDTGNGDTTDDNGNDDGTVTASGYIVSVSPSNTIDVGQSVSVTYRVEGNSEMTSHSAVHYYAYKDGILVYPRPSSDINVRVGNHTVTYNCFQTSGSYTLVIYFPDNKNPDGTHDGRWDLRTTITAIYNPPPTLTPTPTTSPSPTPTPTPSDDHGNSIYSATTISRDSWRNGSIETVGDADFFKFTTSHAGYYIIESSGSTDVKGRLYDSSGYITEDDDSAGNLNFRINHYLEANSVYYFSVRHWNDTSTGSYSVKVTTPTVVQPPQSPTNVAAASTNNSATITWSSVSNATGYDIQRDGTTTYNVTSPHTHSSLSPNTYHTYKVRAKNSGGESLWSSAANIWTLANPPSGGGFSTTTSNSINVYWSANSNSNGTQYKLVVKKYGGLFSGWQQVGNDIWTTQTQHTVTGLDADTEYRFYVSAKNGANIETTVYEIGTKKTSPPVPEKVTGVKLDSASATSLKINWNSVSGAVGYDVERDSTVITDATKPYNHTGLSANTRHSYRVRAKNAGGSGLWSDYFYAYTLANIPSDGSITNKTSSSITASWKGNGNASGTEYAVEVHVNTYIIFWTQVNEDEWTTSLSSTVENLKPNTKYKVKVKARNGDGKITDCLIIGEVTTLNSTPVYNLNPPTIKPTTIDKNTIKLEWNAIQGATGYDIVRYDITQSKLADVEIKTSFSVGQVTTYTDTGLTPNNTYGYSIRAKNSTTTGPWASKVETTTPVGSVPKENDTVLDPVNITTGNFYTTNIDMSIAEVGPALEISRHYSSRDSMEGILGKGWRIGYESSVGEDSDTGMVTVVYPNGRTLQYYYNQSSEYISPEGVFDKLLKNTDGTFTLELQNRTKYKYNTAGKLASISDRNNNTLIMEYNASGMLSKATGASGKWISFIYENGKLKQAADNAGRNVVYTYTTSNLLKSFKDMAGQTTTYTYDSNDLLSSITDQNGNTYVSNQYDDKGRVTLQLDEKHNESTIEYDDILLVNTVTRIADGRTSAYYYNEKYQIFKKVFEDATYEEYTYDEYGNKKTIRDRNGNITAYTYDVRGNLLSIVSPEPFNYETAMVYDANDNMISLQTPGGSQTTFEYDAIGNLLKTIKKLDSSTNAVTSYVYDNYGRLISMTDTEGGVTTYEYAVGPNPVKITDPEGNATTYGYDALGRRTSVTTAYGTSLFEYDNRDKIIKITDPLGNITRMKYDANGNLEALIKPQQYNSSTDSGLATTYAYDAMDRLIKQIDPLGNTSAYKYDMDGNRSKVINANYYNQVSGDGIGLSYEYDESGRLIRITNPSGQQSRIIYDAVGNQLKSIDANQYDEAADNGAGMQYEYDTLNRLISVKDTDSNVIKKIIYDADGRIIKEIDAKGYLSALDDSSRYGTISKYNLDGWLLEKRVPVKKENGTVYYSIKRYTYNKNGKVLQEKKTSEHVTITGEPTAWNNITYTYDKNGRIKTVTDDTGAYMEYTYDALGNTILEKVKINDSKYKVSGYQYDAAGRMVKKWSELDAEDLTNGGSGKVLAETIFEYDKNGNLTKVTRPEGYVTTFEYDAADRLVKKHEEAAQDTVNVKGTSISIAGARTVLYHGQQYEYKLELDTTETIKGIAVDVEYDARLLEPVNVTPSVSGITVNTDTAGKIRLTAASMNANGKVTLATLVFKAKEGSRGTGYISVSPISTYKDITGAEYRFTGLAGKAVAVRMFDMNDDQAVELNDFTYIALQHGVTSFDTNYEEIYDIDANGVVDDADLDIMSNYLLADNNILPELVEAVRFREKTVNSAYVSRSTTTIRTTAYEYDKAGNLVEQTDTNGRSVYYTYDAYNRVIKVTDKEGNTSRTFYDEAGNKIKEVSPQNYNPSTDDGPGVAYLYDAMNRLLEVKNEAGSIASKNTYDISGLVATNTDAAGYVTEYSYDIGDRVLTVTAPEAKLKGKTSISYTYDALGNIKNVTDGEGSTTTYERDMWGRATRITKADGSYELYTYDYAGNMTASTDGNGNTTHYSYNSLNKLAAITDPAGQTISYKYDIEGRLVFEADRNGQAITYVYNSDSSLTYKGIAGKEDYEKYLYNTDGSLLAAINNNAVETYSYTANGLLASESVNGRTTLSYGYNKNGQVVSITGQDYQAGYSYDTMGRLTTLTDGQSIVAEYTYNLDNTVSGVRYNNGINVSYSYDRNKNITSIANRDPQGGTIGNYSYTYDNNGNIICKVENGQTTTYTYDELSRLLSENNTTYSYDNAGNRTSKATGTDVSTYTYDVRNRMTLSAAGGVTTTYSYDNNGNLLTTSGGKVYTYDGFNKLTEVSNPDGTWQVNIYGPDGLRMAVLENGQYTGFTYNGGNVVSEHNAQGSLTASYLGGIGLAAAKDPQGSLSYYLHNAHGDITALAAANGSILNSYSYDAFGNTIGGNTTVANRFMYSGEQFDSITGEYYLRARFYNPVLGRFMQEDTYRGDGLNLYAYVANNPLRYVDPTGHDKITAFPESYREALLELHRLHPEWKFYADYTNVSFDSFVDAEYNYGHVCTSVDKYIEYRNGSKWRDPKYNYDSGYYAAKRDAVEYFMNPANLLDEIQIFQFLSAKYDASVQNLDAVMKVLGDSTLSKFAEAFLESGGTKMNAVFLAAKAMIESGGGDSDLAKGKVDGYKGWYNMYGIGANDGNAGTGGASYAKKKGWDTEEKAIIGGGDWIYNNYTSVGQDTLYSLKWNVASYSDSGKITHQYATNISDAYGKASNFAKGLKVIDAPLVFRIPVFK